VKGVETGSIDALQNLLDLTLPVELSGFIGLTHLFLDQGKQLGGFRLTQFKNDFLPIQRNHFFFHPPFWPVAYPADGESWIDL
jgi:hypothetical protein